MLSFISSMSTISNTTRKREKGYSGGGSGTRRLGPGNLVAEEHDRICSQRNTPSPACGRGTGERGTSEAG